VNFIVRDFRNEDFDPLWGIDQLCFAQGIAYSRAELTFFIRKRNSFTLVAADASGDKSFPSGIAGFTVAEVNAGGAGHIITLDVLPQARRSGIGSKLLTGAEDRLRARGCSIVNLETAVDNRTALAFYKRQGYFVGKTIPRYYSNGVDAFVLSKSLLTQGR
jgi:ribosomal-protein-alanine N-acetyltransferase